MIRHAASEDLARVIIGDWLHSERNHFVVVPPLNCSTKLFELLRQPQQTIRSCDDAIAKLAIALCPHGQVQNAEDLVRLASEKWDVPMTQGYDYPRQLQASVAKVVANGRRPILLLPSFHRIVLQLPEQLGSVLRDLNQHCGLFCVAELPLNWTTLVERWRNEGRTGLICSGFGQGYRLQLLHGYKPNELDEALASHSLPAGFCGSMFELTGGFHFWVDQLLDEARRGIKPPAWKGTLLSSVEFQDFLSYLDAKESSANREAVGRLFHGIATIEDRTALEGHDWADLLLNADGTLSSSAIGIGCSRQMELSASQDFGKAVIRLIRGGSHTAAREVIERSGQQRGTLRLAWLIAQILDWVNSGVDEWARVTRSLQELETIVFPSPQADTVMAIWKDFAAKMLRCYKAHNGGLSPDPIGYFSGSGGAPPDPLTALRLIATRLAWAEQLTSPYLAIVAMLTVPEALMQLYSAIKLDLRYWDGPPVDETDLAEIRLLPQKENFQWPAPGSTLNLGHLIVLGWSRMNSRSLPAKERLATHFNDLDKLQQFYTQYRNPLAHRLTTVKENEAIRYASQCRELLGRIVAILIPDVPLDKLCLPPLDVLFDVTMLPDRSPLFPVADPGNLNVENAKDTLCLSHLVISRMIPGGLSGANVHIVEFRDNNSAPLRIGVLKITGKHADYDRERTGMEKAKGCWLGAHVATQLRCKADNGIGYILSPLAFPAIRERRIDSFHDLLATGEKVRARSTARRLGEIYGHVVGGLIATKCMHHSTPQQHFNRVWSNWQEAAIGFDWKRWGFPARNEQSFADGRRNWVNPLDCLDNGDCWKDKSIISLAWGWQHRDLNARNVLVAPSQPNSHALGLELKFIDLEKVSESSAFLDLSWVSFWALLAGVDREPFVREQTWEQLPDAFIRHSLGRLEGMSGDVGLDCGVFQLSLDCVAEAFGTMHGDGHLIGDPVMLYEMAALTIAGASLAKSFYELRDLQRTGTMDERFRELSLQKARCFFRISARALESFVVPPHGPFVTDLSLPILES